MRPHRAAFRPSLSAAFPASSDCCAKLLGWFRSSVEVLQRADVCDGPLRNCEAQSCAAKAAVDRGIRLRKARNNRLLRSALDYVYNSIDRVKSQMRRFGKPLKPGRSDAVGEVEVTCVQST